MTLVDDLRNEAAVIRILGGEIVDATEMGSYAIEYAVHNWAVFPLNGKAPAIPYPHTKGSHEYGKCKGECGRQGHGVLDATIDVDQIARLWGGHYRGCNIGAQIPDAMFMLDVDNLDALVDLEEKNLRLPETLTTISGRAAGGRHFYFRRPRGKLLMKRLPKGIEIKQHPGGYAVMPPSIHPDTGKRYIRIDAPVAAPPAWLIELLTEPERVDQIKTLTRKSMLIPFFTGPSIADDYSSSTSWADILQPHGWRCLDADPDADGARWLHPTHTSSCSATVRNACLFVWSTSTALEPSEPGNPKGYTRFRAYAVLNHGGDLRTAARAISDQKVVLR
jgi:hypothetical protein